MRVCGCGDPTLAGRWSYHGDTRVDPDAVRLVLRNGSRVAYLTLGDLGAIVVRRVSSVGSGLDCNCIQRPFRGGCAASACMVGSGTDKGHK